MRNLSQKARCLNERGSQSTISRDCGERREAERDSDWGKRKKEEDRQTRKRLMNHVRQEPWSRHRRLAHFYTFTNIAQSMAVIRLCDNATTFGVWSRMRYQRHQTQTLSPIPPRWPALL
jgi:hypothetical protein